MDWCWEVMPCGIKPASSWPYRRKTRRSAGRVELAPRPSRKQVNRLAAQQADRRIALWLQVRHGGRRATDVARENGYSDSSGVYRVIKRLEARAKVDDELAQQLSLLQRQMSDVRS